MNPLRIDIVESYAHEVFNVPISGTVVPHPMWRCAVSQRRNGPRYRVTLDGNLLMYQIKHFDPPPNFVPLDDDLRARILHHHHDSATSGHLGRENTYIFLSRTVYWPHMY